MKKTAMHAAMMAAALTVPACAWATNGYFSNGYGIASQGMAGVGIALPQDALAAAANPAGIAFVGNRFDGDFSLFAPSRGATITGNGYGLDGDYSGNHRSIFVMPELGVTYQIQPNLSAGLAIYANGGMDTSYTNNPFHSLGATGGAGVDLEQLTVSPTLAYKITDQHAIGLGLNIAYQRITVDGIQPFAQSSVAPDNVSNNGVDSTIGVGIHLGYTGQIAPNLTLGVTWASKIHGSFASKYSGLFAGGGSFDIPENYGIGAAYKITPAWTVAADVQRILYGGIASVGNPLSNLFAGNALGSADGPGFGWRNVNVFKIGTTYQVNAQLTLRVGYSHSSQPVPATQTFLNILAPGVVQDQATLGATWQADKHNSFSFFYNHAFQKTVNGAAGSIPAPFGGGTANVKLSENVLGFGYSYEF